MKAARTVWLEISIAIGMLGTIGALITYSRDLFSPAMEPYRDAVIMALAGALLLVVARFIQVLSRSRKEVVDEAKRTRSVTDLADKVKRQWKKEAASRGLEGRELIRIGWSLGPGQDHDPELMERLGRSDADARAIDALSDVFEAIPSQKLVVLGGPGSGKSAAAIKVLLGLLERPTRPPDAPVPVLFRLSSWTSETDLRSWLVERLLDADPDLGSEKDYGPGAARRLLDEGRILPILEGLDEIHDGPADAPMLHRAALVSMLAESKSKSYPGWILTSRIEEFQEIEHAFDARARGDAPTWAPTGWPVEAVVVRLEAPSVAQARDHLLRNTKPSLQPGWDKVLSRLEHPDSALAKAFGTPLIVSLARQVYASAAGGQDVLLGFDHPDEIESHLMAHLIPAVYGDTDRGPGSWTPDEARPWLEFLAVEMERRDEDELRWWDLTVFARPATTVLASLLAGVIGFLAVFLAVLALFNPVAALIFGSVAGAGLGIASVRWPPPEPSGIQISMRDRAAAVLWSGLPIGVLVMAVGTFIRDPVFGVLVGTAFAVPVGMLYGLTVPEATVKLVDPTQLLQRDIRVGVTYAIAYGVPAAIVAWLVSGAVVLGIAAGFAAAAAGGLIYGPVWFLVSIMQRSARDNRRRQDPPVAGSAVGVVAFAHLAIAVLCLAPRRRVPVRYLAFLRDAHARGVLRQFGGVYLFSHRLLQRALAKGAGLNAPTTSGGDRDSVPREAAGDPLTVSSRGATEPTGQPSIGASDA